MALFELKGMDGSSVFVPPGTISRFKSISKAKPADGTKVDYAGKSLFTPERTTDLAARLRGLAPFAKLTLRAGLPVWLNAAQVSEVREAIPLNGPGTEMRVGGAYQHVTEDVDVVVKRIEDALGSLNA